MDLRVKKLAIVGICTGFVLSGAAAEVVFLPRAVPSPRVALKNTPPPTLSQEQMEALLARVAKSLDPDLRTRLADAVLTEPVRGGYDPPFILALVALQAPFPTPPPPPPVAHTPPPLHPPTSP